MTIHVPACPICGMQVYRTRPETEDILPSGLYGNIGTEPVRTMVTATLAEPCGHVMSGDLTEEDDGCRYRFEFHGEPHPGPAWRYGGSPEDFGYHRVDFPDAVYSKTGWYATDPNDPLFLGERKSERR